MTASRTETPTDTAGTRPGADPDAAVRRATRHQRPGWRDPRILVGVLLVAGSVVVGVKVVTGADDTVAVWALRADLPAGSRVGADDVVSERIRFSGAEQADRYLSAAQALPRGRVLDRAVDGGELLPRSALAGAARSLVEVPVSVDTDDVPLSVRQGSVVDVWVSPQGGSTGATGSTTATTGDGATDTGTDTGTGTTGSSAGPADATLVLDDVVVVSAPRSQDSLAPSGTRQVIVGVTRDAAADLGGMLGATASGHVVITRQD